MIDKREIQRLVGKKIKDLRLQKGISLQDMAAFCNFEKANYCRIENGRTNPTIYTLYTIAKNLNVSLSEFLKDIDV